MNFRVRYGLIGLMFPVVDWKFLGSVHMPTIGPKWSQTKVYYQKHVQFRGLSIEFLRQSSFKIIMTVIEGFKYFCLLTFNVNAFIIQNLKFKFENFKKSLL